MKVEDSISTEVLIIVGGGAAIRTALEAAKKSFTSLKKALR